jgi:hypothetical protein
MELEQTELRNIELRKIELLSAIEKQNQNIKTLYTNLENEKAKLVKMNEDLTNLTKNKGLNVPSLDTFYNYPRIYEPLRF